MRDFRFGCERKTAGGKNAAKLDFGAPIGFGGAAGRGRGSVLLL
jgi:hypothetical protein